MTRGRLVAEALHLLALGIWLGGLGIAGLAAARVFRAMRELDPHLPGFAEFGGAHWSIAGGRAVLPLFFFVDVVQFVCLLVAGGLFAAATGFLGLSVRRISTFARAFVLFALIAILSYRFFAVQPGMMQSLIAYWQAAAAGETDEALQYKGAFDQAHQLDQRLMMVTLLLVLGGIGTALWSIVDSGPERGPERGDADGGGDGSGGRGRSQKTTQGELEEPLLARSAGGRR